MIGGFDVPQGVVLTVFRLDKQTGAGAAAYDGTRIVFADGSVNGKAQDNIWALTSAGWTPIATGLQQPREHFAAATDGHGTVWFIGAKDGDTASPLVDVVQGNKVTPGPRVDASPDPRR